MDILYNHHKEIVSFLKDVKNNNPSEFSFIGSNTRERKLLNTIIDEGNERILQKSLVKSLGTGTGNIGRTIRRKLNSYLEEFSSKLGINPPIQLYFNTEGEKESGGHFACCDIKLNANKSQSWIGLEGLKKQLDNARKVLGLTSIISINDNNLELYIPVMKKKQNLFRYEYQWTQFIGRNDEMKQLHKFANYPNEKLLWWLITGKAGTGKSRLALELCLKLKKKGWNAGFLMDDEQLNKLNDWLPQKPILIIIDYSYGEAKRIGNFFGKLYMKNNWDCPIRILFLNRRERSDALRKFRSTYHEIYEETNYCNIVKDKKKVSLKLKNLKDDYILRIASEVFEKQKKIPPSENDIKQIKDYLTNNICDKNPLYAMFLADAYSRTGNIRNWDKEQLHNEILGHYKKLWEDAGIDENNIEHRKHVNLLAFSTNVNGVSIQSNDYRNILYSEPDSLNILPQVYEIRDAVYELLCDNIVDSKLHALAPDILGEYFVLMHYKENIRIVEVLTKLAWSYKPWAVIEFITRSVEDFPDNKIINRIVQYLESDERFDYRKSVLFRNLVGQYSDVGNIVMAEKYFNQIDRLWHKHKQDKFVSLQFARAGLNLISNHKDINRATKYYNRLKDLLKSYKTDEYISLQLSRAEFCLVYDYGKIGAIETAKSFFNHIYLSWKQYHPRDKYISLHLAKAGFCLVYDCLNTSNYKLAKEMSNKVSELKPIHKTDEYISLKLAKLSKIISSYPKAN